MATKLQAIIEFVYQGAGVNQAASGLNTLLNAGAKMGKSWADIATPLNQTVQLFQQAGRAAAQAYEYVSEGTQLATTAHQFDALSNSIGSTSDALLGDLKTATRGTISDAQLMASATSIMSLRLADTSEETVRLASLVGKLGWDMNQVTLTLANQSTMRLDSLGLSVEDVTGRIQALKDAGYSADQAFKFAILEAGEEKVTLLGDSADTTAGQLKILETNVANAGDSFKMAFSENFIQNLNATAGGLFEVQENASSLFSTLGAFATNFSFMGFIRAAKDGIADMNTESNTLTHDGMAGMVGMGGDVTKAMHGMAGAMSAGAKAAAAHDAAVLANIISIDDRSEAIRSHNQVLQDGMSINQANTQAVYESSDAYSELQERIGGSQYIQSNAAAVRVANQRLVEWGQTIPTITGAIYASSESIAAYNANLGKLYVQAGQTEDAELLLNSGIRQTSGGLREVSNLTEQQTDDLERMESAYDKAAGTIRDYELGVKGANLTDEERNEKIAEQQQIMATLTANMQPLIAAGSEWVAVSGQMVSFGPAVADAFLQSGEAIGMNATQLAGLELAFSDMSAAGAEAMIKEVLLREEITRLTEEVKNKNLTIYEARDAYIAFQEGLNDSTLAVNSTTGSVLLMNDSMVSSATTTQNLIDKFGLFPDEVGTKVTVDTSEAEGRLSSLEARLAGLGSGGAPATASGGYQSGPNAPGFASGGDFIVPPGYPNDSYPMRVQSGERVTVTPAGQARGGDTYNIYMTPANPDNIMQTINYLKATGGV